ncbi:MAG TPA: helix-turn-helix transcriptional regulator [Longimicrobiales bacterium]|nr:helix-turn-helix transcriptional regulator [Longimicrobiales bacterium]
MVNHSLGEFEQLVLLAILHVRDGAYAVPVRRVIEERTGRPVTRGALYTALERLDAKGLVRSKLGESTPERGGRPKRYFRVTAEGRAALRHSHATLTNMWHGLESELGRTS